MQFEDGSFPMAAFRWRLSDGSSRMKALSLVVQCVGSSWCQRNGSSPTAALGNGRNEWRFLLLESDFGVVRLAEKMPSVCRAYRHVQSRFKANVHPLATSRMWITHTIWTCITPSSVCSFSRRLGIEFQVFGAAAASLRVTSRDEVELEGCRVNKREREETGN